MHNIFCEYELNGRTSENVWDEWEKIVDVDGCQGVFQMGLIMTIVMGISCISNGL